MVRTDYPFTLPKGLVDGEQVHRDGRMRLITARDELEALGDPRAREDEHWLTVVLLARSITTLGSLPAVTTDTILRLFAADLAHVQEVYTAINFGDPSTLLRPRREKKATKPRAAAGTSPKSGGAERTPTKAKAATS